MRWGGSLSKREFRRRLRQLRVLSLGGRRRDCLSGGMKFPKAVVVLGWGAGWLAAAEPSPVLRAMEGFIDDREIAGAVTLVADRGRVMEITTSGHADLEKKVAMKEDTLFWIASMTKPVTGTAVMMLAEEGKLSIDDPVSKHLPEFAGLKDGAGKPVVVTLRQCLTHSSGLAEVEGGAAQDVADLAALVPLIVAQPVKFEPGSRWAYCQSSINTAARVVEVVSGKRFVDFLEERLFGPLGMKDTTFYPDEARLARLATSYRRTNEGALEPAELYFLGGKGLLDRNRYPRANGGLFSTAGDYGRFARMILRGGELDGRRYLGEEAVKSMTSVLSGDLRTGFTPGNGWGLGWCVVREPQGVTADLSPGSFGHGGAFGTQAWIDPVKGRACILMVQRANFPNSDASEVRRAFQRAAAALP